MTIKRIVVISDLQVPYHDRVATKNVAGFIAKFRPDQVVTIGDEIDLPQISRWEDGRMGSYAQTLDNDRNEAVELLWKLGVTDCIRSNHTDRLYSVIMSKIPAFAALPELRFEKFMRFDELGITFHKTPMNIAPGWIAVHGDQTPIKPYPGMSALEAARRTGKNVISGHTHRAGRSAFTEAVGGRIGRVLHGVEVGNLMDSKQAHYMKGSMNWQSAFAIVYVHAKKVQVDIINIEKDGTFIVAGKIYGRSR